MTSYSPERSPSAEKEEKQSVHSRKESDASKRSGRERRSSRNSNDSPRNSRKREHSEEGERSHSRDRYRRRKRRRSRRRSRSGSGRSTPSEEIKNTGEVVYINNLDRRVREKDLTELFKEYGEIDSVEVVKDPFTKESRGFAFVTFSSKDAAEASIEALNKTDFQGRIIKVEISKRKKGRGPTPGRYLGKFRRRRRQ